MTKGVQRARQIAAAVCKVFNIRLRQLIEETRVSNVKMARGIYCLVCDIEEVHPLFSSIIIKRTRQNVVNISRHYNGYFQSKDKEVVSYTERVMQLLRSRDNEQNR